MEALSPMLTYGMSSADPSFLIISRARCTAEHQPTRLPVRFEQGMVDATALGGAATRMEVRLLFGPSGRTSMSLLLYLPNRCVAPAPLVSWPQLPLWATTRSAQIPRSRCARSGCPEYGYQRRNRTPCNRGIARRRSSALAGRAYHRARLWSRHTAYYGDLDPDFDDGFHNGVHALFSDAGQPERTGAAWGAIGAWAWGLSRAMDYFEQDQSIDHTRVALIGHSRFWVKRPYGRERRINVLRS